MGRGGKDCEMMGRRQEERGVRRRGTDIGRGGGRAGNGRVCKVMGRERQNCRVVGRGGEGDGRGGRGSELMGKGTGRERESCEVLTKRQGWLERAAK